MEAETRAAKLHQIEIDEERRFTAKLALAAKRAKDTDTNSIRLFIRRQGRRPDLPTYRPVYSVRYEDYLRAR